ncbi:MAG: hypothetical protein BZ151_08500 [Desulfobacca sp. 4484_104]|nr:MAG: hypothetical protein BZ151_08500 [Desulfobacca sp. 4484_104]
MLFLFIEPPQEEVGWNGTGIQSRVRVIGPQTFTVGITVPLALGCQMATNFLGSGDQELTLENVFDALKEVTNVIAGNFVNKLKTGAAYQVQIPEAQPVFLEYGSHRPIKGVMWFEVDGQLIELFIKNG